MAPVARHRYDSEGLSQPSRLPRPAPLPTLDSGAGRGPGTSSGTGAARRPSRHQRPTICACEIPMTVRRSSPTDAAKVFPEPRDRSLAFAVARGNAIRIRQLVADGANPNALGAEGMTPLHWAMVNRSVPGFAALLDAGADLALVGPHGATVIHWAAQANDPAYLRCLLKHGVDPDPPHALTGVTPLMSALMAERGEQFALLLAAGADPGRVDRMGNTALHVAAKINEPARILDLLAAGAPASARNRAGQTFQPYLFMTPESLLNDQARHARRSVVAWLRLHGEPVEA